MTRRAASAHSRGVWWTGRIARIGRRSSASRRPPGARLLAGRSRHRRRRRHPRLRRFPRRLPSTSPRRRPVRPPARSGARPSTASGGTLFGIHVVNTLLTLVTLGFYYFWAKTRLRRYLFGQTEIEGDRFAYHGTGRELLLGTLKAVLVFGVPIYLLNLIRDVLDVPALVKVAAGLLSASLLFVLFPVAMVGARRYRLGRTSWRGIRFSFRGRVWELVKIVIVGSFLTGLTLGLYYPVLLVKRQAFMISNSYFGNERFDFAGRGRDLFWVYVQAILLTLPTLGPVLGVVRRAQAPLLLGPHLVRHRALRLHGDRPAPCWASGR